MLENDSVEFNKELLRFVVMKIRMLEPVLPYLGEKKYV
jgi:hypothetical protein